MVKRAIDGLEADLAQQQEVTAKTSPLYNRLFSHLIELMDEATRSALAEAWASREFEAFYERPLLLALGLHRDALVLGGTAPLAAALPSCGGVERLLTRDRVRKALDMLLASSEGRDLLRTAYVQTNETTRGPVWMFPVARFLSPRYPTVQLVDLGASAGLNLVADQLPVVATLPNGAPLEIGPLPRISRRLGIDRNPLDLRNAESRLRLEAAIWPDNLWRLRRFSLAASAAANSLDRGEIELAVASGAAMVDKAATLLKGSFEPVVLFHSMTVDYFTKAEAERFNAKMMQLMTTLPKGSLWLSFESLATRPETNEQAGPLVVDLVARLWDKKVGAVVAARLARSEPHPLNWELVSAGIEQVEATLGQQ